MIAHSYACVATLAAAAALLSMLPPTANTVVGHCVLRCALQESADADAAEPGAGEQPPADAQTTDAPGEAAAPAEGAKPEVKAPAVKKKVKKTEEGDQAKTEKKSKPRKPKVKVRACSRAGQSVCESMLLSHC